MAPEFNRAAFTQVVDKSGLTKAELAFIYDTSRQTIYNQINGGCPTSIVLIRTYNKISTGLVRAMEKRLLPFVGLVSKEERKKRIAAIIKILHATK